MGVAWDVLTKDDTPEYLDAYDQWFGVDKPTSFRLARRYYGITSVRPASLSYPLPVDDNSISASVKMMRYDSSDGDFQFSDEVRAENVNIGVSVKKGNTELKNMIDSVLSTMTADDMNALMEQAIAIQPLSE